MLYERDAGLDRGRGRAATVIVLGPRMLAVALTDGPRSPDAIGRAHPAEHAAFAQLPPADRPGSWPGGPVVGRRPARRGPIVDDPDVQRGHDDMVKAALPIKVRSRLEQLLTQIPAAALDLASYRAACERSADRAALLLGGTPSAIAALATARGESHGHLISAIAQPGWLALRARLGLGVH
jgi:hypothetical protein